MGALGAIGLMIAFGLACLAYGKAGMELRKAEGRSKVIWLAACVICIGIVSWGMSLGFWIGGIANKDKVLCIVSTFLLPVLYPLWAFYIRRCIKSEIAALEREAEVERQEEEKYAKREAEARLKWEASKQAELEKPVEKIAVIVDRSEETLACPNCKRMQRSDRRFCYNCGAVFEEA